MNDQEHLIRLQKLEKQQQLLEQRIVTISNKIQRLVVLVERYENSYATPSKKP